MAEFNLKDVFRNAFGYEAPPSFNIPQASQRITSSQYTGSPYYAEDLEGREFFLPVTLNGILIPFAVMSMNWRKNIVSTPMPERGGAVHELISYDDYVFNVKGLLVNENDDFPEAGIIEMHELFRINSSVEMLSVMSSIVLNGTSNHQVIIKSIQWPAVSGIEHVKPFEMSLESNQIFDLEIDPLKEKPNATS